MGRFLLRGIADRRDRAQGLGFDPGGRKARRYGQSHRNRYSENAYRGRPPANRRASTRATIRSSGSTVTVSKKEDPIDILAVDNTAVREAQIKRLNELRANRDEAKVKAALAAITECVRTKKGNLLELAVEAAKVRASLGEISDACEEVVGRYKAVIRSISGVYSAEVKNDESFAKAKQMAEQFAKRRVDSPAS